MEQSTGTSKDINISLSVLDRTRSNKLRINIKDLNNTLNFHLPVTKTSAYKAPADKEGLLCLYIGGWACGDCCSQGLSGKAKCKL